MISDLPFELRNFLVKSSVLTKQDSLNMVLHQMHQLYYRGWRNCFHFSTLRALTWWAAGASAAFSQVSIHTFSSTLSQQWKDSRQREWVWSAETGKQGRACKATLLLPLPALPRCMTDFGNKWKRPESLPYKPLTCNCAGPPHDVC